jgi:hypothetical protein
MCKNLEIFLHGEGQERTEHIAADRCVGRHAQAVHFPRCASCATSVHRPRPCGRERSARSSRCVRPPPMEFVKPAHHARQSLQNAASDRNVNCENRQPEREHPEAHHRKKADQSPENKRGASWNSHKAPWRLPQALDHSRASTLDDRASIDFLRDVVSLWTPMEGPVDRSASESQNGENACGYWPTPADFACGR